MLNDKYVHLNPDRLPLLWQVQFSMTGVYTTRGHRHSWLLHYGFTGSVQQLRWNYCRSVESFVYRKTGCGQQDRGHKSSRGQAVSRV